VESSCELGNEPSGSIKMLGICRVAAQLVASRVVFSSTELVGKIKQRRMVSSGLLRCVALVRTRATRRNNPEDTILHSHRRENLKSYKLSKGS
jgi:hypothetical protein